jgi:sigma-B regulation protein RsbU (phosphoserine phosphatase)
MPILPVDKAALSYRIKVLLIDDQQIVCDAVRVMLSGEADLEFRATRDPAEAFRLAQEFKPTIILQDLVMPDVEGLTMVRYFRRHPALREIPLVVLSSKEEAFMKAEAFSAGANDYLVKLPDKMELIARIRYHSKAYINLLERNDAFAALLQSRNELSSELAHAAHYLNSLLPQPIVQGPIRLDWRFKTSVQLGGDSFGYHWIDENHLAVYLLDVCGHGVGSALLSVTALNVLKMMTLVQVDFRNPEVVLARMNEIFPMENHNNLYFTLWYGVYEKTQRRLTHASAGHPAPVLISAEHPRGIELMTQNLPIGTFADVEYQGDSLILPDPSRLYIFSDGIYEVANPENRYWGRENLQAFFARPGNSRESELDALLAELQAYRGSNSFEDDISLIRVEFD